MEWQPIETAPEDIEIILAVYIVPSPFAQSNGAKPFWDISSGSLIYKGKWSGVLGGRPTHWMPLPAPPKDGGRDAQ